MGSEEQTQLSERARQQNSREGQLEITEKKQQHISETLVVHSGDELQQSGELVDVDERLAEVMEAELLPLDNSLSTPALKLMAFQRDAQGSHLLEVGEVLAQLLAAVEESQGQALQTQAGGIGVMPVLQYDGGYLSIAEQRRAIENAFGLQIRVQVQSIRPAWMTRKDDASVVRHADNHRRGIV